MHYEISHSHYSAAQTGSGEKRTGGRGRQSDDRHQRSGTGPAKGVTEIYRGAKEAGGLLNKVRLDIAVNEDFVEPTVKAITKGAHTGSVGDGKIFIVELAECIRISSGERGGLAIG